MYLRFPSQPGLGFQRRNSAGDWALFTGNWRRMSVEPACCIHHTNTLLGCLPGPAPKVPRSGWTFGMQALHNFIEVGRLNVLDSSGEMLVDRDAAPWRLRGSSSGAGGVSNRATVTGFDRDRDIWPQKCRRVLNRILMRA